MFRACRSFRSAGPQPRQSFVALKVLIKVGSNRLLKDLEGKSVEGFRFSEYLVCAEEAATLHVAVLVKLVYPFAAGFGVFDGAVPNDHGTPFACVDLNNLLATGYPTP